MLINQVAYILNLGALSTILHNINLNTMIAQRLQALVKYRTWERKMVRSTKTLSLIGIGNKGRRQRLQLLKNIKIWHILWYSLGMGLGKELSAENSVGSPAIKNQNALLALLAYSLESRVQTATASQQPKQTLELFSSW